MKIYAQKIDDKVRGEATVLCEISDVMRELKNGCIEIDVKRARKHKSHQQVKMIFGLMIESTIIQANDLGIDTSYFLKYLVDSDIPKGQGLTKDFLHQIMYAVCPTADDDGRRVTLSKMSTKQAGNLFESFRNIVAPLGIVISNPDPNWAQEIFEK